MAALEASERHLAPLPPLHRPLPLRLPLPFMTLLFRHPLTFRPPLNFRPPPFRPPLTFRPSLTFRPPLNFRPPPFRPPLTFRPSPFRPPPFRPPLTFRPPPFRPPLTFRPPPFCLPLPFRLFPTTFCQESYFHSSPPISGCQLGQRNLFLSYDVSHAYLVRHLCKVSQGGRRGTLGDREERGGPGTHGGHGGRERMADVRVTGSAAEKGAITEGTDIAEVAAKRPRIEGQDRKTERAEGSAPSSRTLPAASKKEEAAAAVPESVYIAGRYLKFSRALSQSPWTVDDEQMGDGSVQDLIASHVLPLLQPLSHKFQAAGREDIDVRMLGSGRPFLLELKGVRRVPSAEELRKIEQEINEQERGKVGVCQLQLADSRMCTLMRQGEAEKQKSYVAVVWISRSITQADVAKLESIKDLELQQKTPIRVLHRRSPLTRPRTIYSMRCHLVPSNPHVFLLHLTTQAGTYVKEFVHGDFGRTQPNIGLLLGSSPAGVDGKHVVLTSATAQAPLTKKRHSPIQRHELKGMIPVAVLVVCLLLPTALSGSLTRPAVAGSATSKDSSSESSGSNGNSNSTSQERLLPFVQFSAYRISGDQFALVGLAARELAHVRKVGGCAWEPGIPASQAGQGGARDEASRKFEKREERGEVSKGGDKREKARKRRGLNEVELDGREWLRGRVKERGEEGREEGRERRRLDAVELDGSGWIRGKVKQQHVGEHHFLRYAVLILLCTLKRETPAGEGGRLHMGMEGEDVVVYEEQPGEVVTAMTHAPFLYNITHCSPPIPGQPLLDGGIAEITDFRDLMNYESWYYGQLMIINDCVYRFRRLSKWIMYLDFDEFMFINGQEQVPTPLNVHDFLVPYEGMTYVSHGCLVWDYHRCLPSQGDNDPRWQHERMLWHKPEMYCIAKDNSTDPTMCLGHYGRRKLFVDPRK
ncbi:unnamed protein product, partial [Closterium sp. Yama58-4]